MVHPQLDRRPDQKTKDLSMLLFTDRTEIYALDVFAMKLMIRKSTQMREHKQLPREEKQKRFQRERIALNGVEGHA